MAVYDSYGAQQFYFSNVLKYDPDQFGPDFTDKLAQKGNYKNDDNYGDAMVGVKQPLPNTIHRTQHDKNAETISLLDFGVVGDGIADDTVAYQNAAEIAESKGFALFVPANITIRITSPSKIPRHGIFGNNRMTSKILIDIPDATDETYGLTYNTTAQWKQAFGSVRNLWIGCPDETESKVTLVKINTPSRGAGMRDVTLHCRRGNCIAVEQFFYYTFDNVVFEGKFIDLSSVTEENEIKGNAFKMTKEEINNIAFIKCEFRFLETVFAAKGVFVGSNNIMFFECAMESLGKHLGDLSGLNATFSSCYLEGLGKNKHDSKNWDESIAKTGAGDIIFNNNTLFNLVGTNVTLPLFTAVIGGIIMEDVKGGPTDDFESNIIKPITHSTRGFLIIKNSPRFNRNSSFGVIPAYRGYLQQHLDGYPNPGAGTISYPMKTANISDYELEIRGETIIETREIKEASEAYIGISTEGSYFITVDAEILIRKRPTPTIEGSNALIISRMMFFIPVSFSGGKIIPTVINTKVETGDMFDPTWDIPYDLRFGLKNKGYTRLALWRTRKTTTDDYYRDISSTLKIKITPLSYKGTTSITPVF
jgi:hypothetical protein